MRGEEAYGICSRLDGEKIDRRSLLEKLIWKKISLLWLNVVVFREKSIK